MELKITKLIVNQNKGWKAYYWDEPEEKDLSICVLEIEPGGVIDHAHLLETEFESEIIMEGEATYEGEIDGVYKFGDILNQFGKSGRIKLYNKSNKPLKILCINRPPWRPEHEKSFGDRIDG